MSDARPQNFQDFNKSKEKQQNIKMNIFGIMNTTKFPLLNEPNFSAQ